MEFVDHATNLAVPKRAAGLARISFDPEDTERGVKRQTTDIRSKHTQLGWQGTLQVIIENDTSAFKRRKVSLPDGSKALRVVRPEFDLLLKNIHDGTIDGLIVYDLDRLVRQPRQMEDLIDAVEATRIPVHSYSSGYINLTTSDGRAMARVICAMALKSSEDTARRVTRAAFENAKEGTVTRGGPRRFGWEPDGVRLREDEVTVIREMVRRATAGESLWSVCMWLNESGIKPVCAPRREETKSASWGQWTRSAVNQILRAPRLAGIRQYTGKGRGRSVPINDWRNRCATNGDAYVMGQWAAAITVNEWADLQAALDSDSRPNRVPTGKNARVHLLTPLLRCGSCGSRMVGHRGNSRRPNGFYQCRPKDLGGCNGVSRDMKLVDELIIELLMRRLEQRALTGTRPTADAVELERAIAEESRLKESKASLLNRWKRGAIPDSDYFQALDALNLALSREQAVILGTRRSASRKIVAKPRGAWEKASLSERQLQLSEELTSITIMPQVHANRWGWNPADVQPSWRE